MSVLSPSCSGAGRCAGGRGEQLGAVPASIAPARISTEFLTEPLVCLLSSSLISEEVSPSAQVMEVSFMGLRAQYPILAKSPARGNVSLGCRNKKLSCLWKFNITLSWCYTDSSVWVSDVHELLIYPSTSVLHLIHITLYHRFYDW